MSPDRVQPAEIIRNVVAARFEHIPFEQSESFGARIATIIQGIHFESDSFILPKAEAVGIITEFNEADVTGAYIELLRRTEGFRVVKIGSPFISNEFKGRPNRAMIIKNYETGNLTVFNETGKVEGVIPENHDAIAYSASRFRSVLENPLQFFGSLERAVTSRAVT